MIGREFLEADASRLAMRSVPKDILVKTDAMRSIKHVSSANMLAKGLCRVVMHVAQNAVLRVNVHRNATNLQLLSSKLNHPKQQQSNSLSEQVLKPPNALRFLNNFNPADNPEFLKFLKVPAVIKFHLLSLASGISTKKEQGVV